MSDKKKLCPFKKAVERDYNSNYIHIARQTYSLYETGRRDIPTDVLIRLARFYHTSTDYLLGLTDRPEPYP